MDEPFDLSVVVPLYNEEMSVAPLVDAVSASLGTDMNWELILVDDGSSDATARAAEEAGREQPRVRLVRLIRNYGQTTAMQAGFDHARGRIVVSMDGDLQNDPRDIPRLVDRLNEGFDLVAGYREHRQDNLVTRKIPSRAANLLLRWLTGLPIRDNGCSLKAYRRELLDRVRLYSDLHRFIPAVAAGMAGARIAEVPVRHHARRYGRSKYGLTRVLKVLSDLLVVQMIRFFRESPLLMFAFLGSLAILCGLAFAAAATISTMLQSEDVNVLVLPSAALLWFGLACYLFMLGLLGEVAVRSHRQTYGAADPLSHEVLP